MTLILDTFETPGPVTVTPPTRNFKNFKFFPNSLKILNVDFWGDNIHFWEIRFTLEEIRFTLADSRRF